jgi:hypothetical protein
MGRFSASFSFYIFVKAVEERYTEAVYLETSLLSQPIFRAYNG